MFCPDGFVTLFDLYEQFVWDGSTTITRSPDRPIDPNFDYIDNAPQDEEVFSFALWLVCALLRGRFKTHIALLSGQTVIVDREIFRWSDVTQEFAKDYSIDRSFPENFKARISILERKFINFEPYEFTVSIPEGLEFHKSIRLLNGLPICFRESDFPVPVERLTDWLVDDVAQRNLEAQSTEEIANPSDAQKIVSAFQNGKFSTKSEAKRLLFPDMKFEAWRALWREAASIDPHLSRPGPRNQ